MTSDLDHALDEGELQLALANFAPCSVRVLAETGSTNADLLRLGDADPVTRILLAEQQTAGRGRLARSWVSDPGGSLLVSVSLRLPRRLSALQGLSLAVGVSLAETLNRLGVAVRLKWPNDLWVDGRKLGGILVELLPPAPGHSRVVIGFGINVRLSAERRAETTQAVTDLREQGLLNARQQIAGLLLQDLLRSLAQFGEQGFAPFQARFAALDGLRGVSVRLGETETGIMSGVDAQGRLLLEQDGTVRAFEAGELSVRRNE